METDNKTEFVRDEYTQGQAFVPKQWGDAAREDIVDFIVWCGNKEENDSLETPEHLKYIIDAAWGDEQDTLISDASEYKISYDVDGMFLTKDAYADTDITFDSLGAEILLSAVATKYAVPACFAATVTCAYYGDREPYGYSSMVWADSTSPIPPAFVTDDPGIVDILVRGTLGTGRKMSYMTKRIIWSVIGSVAMDAYQQCVLMNGTKDIDKLIALRGILERLMVYCADDIEPMYKAVCKSADIVVEKYNGNVQNN